MTATRDQIIFCAKMLLNHSDYWKVSSADITSLASAARSISIRGEAWAWPGLQGLKSSYESLTSQTFQDALKEGQECTQKTSDLLHEAAVAYIKTEAENTELSDSILAELEL